MHSALNPKTFEKHVITISHIHQVNSLFSFSQRTLGHTYEAYKHNFKLDLLKLLINENVFFFQIQNLSCVSSVENLAASAQAIWFILNRNKMGELGW